jgi:dTDP-4-dehydrorhamnose reductase
MTTPGTVVIGRSSPLARAFIERFPGDILRAAAHGDASREAVYDDARCVVNFAFAPALESGEYQHALDLDLAIAAIALRRGCHYVMISSRRVYARGMQWNVAETATASGMDAYGRNKARIEAQLRDLLGDRLTVLRPANVVAYEPFPGRRRFGAFLQNQLREQGRIRITVDPAERRDLVPVDFFSEVVRAAATLRHPGTYNVGAGCATSVGDAARWLLAGYGGDELICEPSDQADEFQLDCTRLKDSFGLACPEGAVEGALRAIGRRLAAAR